MRKQVGHDPEGGQGTRRPSRRWVAAAVLALALAPLAFEAGAICLARWRGMFGETPHVATPALDAVSSWGDGAWRSVVRAVRPQFHDVPWKPEVVVLFGCGWALVLGRLFRRV